MSNGLLYTRSANDAFPKLMASESSHRIDCHPNSSRCTNPLPTELVISAPCESLENESVRRILKMRRRALKLSCLKLALWAFITLGCLKLSVIAFFGQSRIKQSFSLTPENTVADDTVFSWRESSSSDICYSDARVCYGYRDAWFEVYTMIVNLDLQQADAVMRNTLKWTTQHGARYCVQRIIYDGSRTVSWNKVAATADALARSRAKWALSLDADALINSFEISPQDILRRIERESDERTFASKVLFFSDDFGAKKRINPINAGVYIMRVDERTIKFLSKVWNNYHGINLLHFPYYEEQAALRNFMMQDPTDFEQDAVILPYSLFNSYWREERKPDDFVVHYAGFGRGFRGPERYAEKFDALTRIINERLKDDEPPARSPVDMYSGRTRFMTTSLRQKLLLRLNPTKIVLNASAARPDGLARCNGVFMI